MTKEQLISSLDESNMDAYVHIPGLRYIAFRKDKFVIRSDVRDVRFKFDTVNEILEVVYVRPYATAESGKLPWHGNYETSDLDGVSTVFEYLSNQETGETIRDFYSFEGITTLGFNSLA
jgi:hypothetical protein